MARTMPATSAAPYRATTTSDDAWQRIVFIARLAAARSNPANAATDKDDRQMEPQPEAAARDEALAAAGDEKKIMPPVETAAEPCCQQWELCGKPCTPKGRALALTATRNDARRLEWIERHIFERKWNGVIDSGSRTYWSIAPDYRHTVANMHGATFAQAIDAAISRGEKMNMDDDKEAGIRKAALARRDYVLWLAKALENGSRLALGKVYGGNDAELDLEAAQELRKLVEG